MNLNMTILGQSISFFLFVVFCMKYVWPPLIAVIKKRQKEISDDLHHAQHARKKSEILYSESVKQLELAKIKAQNIIERAYQYKIEILSNAKDEANTEFQKILSVAKQEIDLERNRVFEELRQKAVYLVVAAVKKVVCQSINYKINNDIVNNIINKL